MERGMATERLRRRVSLELPSPFSATLPTWALMLLMCQLSNSRQATVMMLRRLSCT